jgi:hypothetical protein
VVLAYSKLAAHTDIVAFLRLDSLDASACHGTDILTTGKPVVFGEPICN